MRTASRSRRKKSIVDGFSVLRAKKSVSCLPGSRWIRTADFCWGEKTGQFALRLAWCAQTCRELRVLCEEQACKPTLKMRSISARCWHCVSGMHADGHGLVAIYVRLPGSPDLAQYLCSEAAASSLRCRTAAEDGIAAELESRGKHGNLLLTTPTAPAEATVPSGAFYFVSLTNPLEALSASPLTSTTRNAPRRNPQCAALLPPGETASLAACTRLWTELSRRCSWVGDLHDARAHRVLVTALVS